MEFVSCCGSPTQNRLPAEEEERWLVRVPPDVTSRPLSRNRRGRTGARGHDWRPSLGSISEDISVSSSSSRERTDPCNGAAAAAASTSRDVKRKSSGVRGGGGGAAKARHRSYDEGDYR